jgi:hypothetical protein
MYDFNFAHPNQGSMYLDIIKKQLTGAHRAILETRRPAVAEFGCAAWLGNLDCLIGG